MEDKESARREFLDLIKRVQEDPDTPLEISPGQATRIMEAYTPEKKQGFEGLLEKAYEDVGLDILVAGVSALNGKVGEMESIISSAELKLRNYQHQLRYSVGNETETEDFGEIVACEVEIDELTDNIQRRILATRRRGYVQEYLDRQTT